MPPKQKKPPAPAASDFEYCDVCRRNHDQGRRHRYFPAHRAALAAALARFRSKLADLRASLLHTSPPRPDHPHRLWCLFCSVDLPDDLGSRFACNAIYHLASGEHLRGVKDFLRKHGGGMDLVDSFRISEAELAKWVKDCESLNAGAETLNEGLIGPSLGPLKDIRNESTYNLDTFAETDIPSFSSSASYVVMPLQSATYGAYHPTSTVAACDGASGFGSVPYSAQFGARQSHIAPWELVSAQEQKSTLDVNMFHNANVEIKDAPSTSLGNGIKPSTSCSGHSGVVQRSHSGGNSNGGSKANVHTGAPPPWLRASGDETCLLNKVSFSSYVLSSSQKEKSRKLNPRRVGAAWAEKRKAEMEMEKRGELVAETSDATWLPNFGRVWQSGTRKDSRKEFEKHHKLYEKNSHYELSSEIKPYISKRMRVGSVKDEKHQSPVEE